MGCMHIMISIFILVEFWFKSITREHLNGAKSCLGEYYSIVNLLKVELLYQHSPSLYHLIKAHQQAHSISTELMAISSGIGSMRFYVVIFTKKLK